LGTVEHRAKQTCIERQELGQQECGVIKGFGVQRQLEAIKVGTRRGFACGKDSEVNMREGERGRNGGTNAVDEGESGA
jgi:hypothetical protein